MLKSFLFAEVIFKVLPRKYENMKEKKKTTNNRAYLTTKFIKLRTEL